MKALLVEDNAADARLIREMLREAAADSFQLHHVTRLDAALRRLQEEAFDLLLLDLGLPDAQGMGTLSAVQKVSRGVPIVVLTGLDDERFALEVVRAGAQDYLNKGRFDGQLLWRVMRYAVERKRAQEEVRRLNAELERRVAERTAALEVVARKFATMFDTTSDGVWIHNLQGQIVEVNDAYCRMSGYSREELVGALISKVEAKETAREIAEHIRKLLDEGGHDRFESRHRRKDGSLFDVDITALHLAIDGGRIAIFVRDITERKQAEEAARQSEQRAREQALQLQAVLDAAPALIWVTRDPECKHIDGNRVAFEFLRVPSGRSLSKTGAETEHLAHYRVFQDGVELAPRELPIQRVAASGQGLTDCGIDFVFDDGTIRSALGNVVPLRDTAGAPAGAVAVFLDITARKLSEEALIRAEKLASVGRLAATIAHEINNPLEAATNALYLVGADKSLSPQSRSLAEVAERELRRVGEIARRILGFYREPEHKTAVVLSELVKELAALYEPKLRNNHIQLQVRCRDEAAAAFANRGEMRQLFSNLLANGIDAFAQAGTMHIRIRPLAMNGAPFVAITVADTASGISPQHMKRVFEPFFTTRKNVGSGLGLWICAEIVKRHGGKIRVRSRLGKGTVFCVRLPAVAQAVAASVAAAGA